MQDQAGILKGALEARRNGAAGDRGRTSYSYFNRELSLLEFNGRVLEEALDVRHPLLERLFFLSIFSNNLDEFFMIRVSGLKQQVRYQIRTPSPDGLSPIEQLTQISNKLRPMLEVHRNCLLHDVLPRLYESGVRIVPYADLTKTQQRQMRDYFEREVFPTLSPLVVDASHPFPHISNLSLNLGVEVADPKDPSEVRFARLKVPETLPRFVPLPGRQTSYVLLEDIITAHVGRLFHGMIVLNCHVFRITRDADIEIEEDEAEDLLLYLQDELRRRRFKEAVRLQVDRAMPTHLRERLRKVLRLDPQDVYLSTGPIGAASFAQLTRIDRPDLKYAPYVPVVPPRLMVRQDIFTAIRERDILLHHPFDSFEPVVAYFEEAAEDPSVLAIKMTLYRTSGDSPIIESLIKAAENGKQVAVLLELMARFDEEKNIQWARKLEQVGVHVVYGVRGLKVHAKLGLVVRREEKGLRRYLHLGTGNYNPSTARIYTDLSLLTCNDDLGADASELFNFLTGFSKLGDFRRLMVAPDSLRPALLKLIRREEEVHKSGEPGHIIVKSNSLTDIELINALYRASRAGVRIDLIIRGTCCLCAGIPGLSENIRVVSIVGRFLEHSRIFYFRNGGRDELYMGSADWMSRNLDGRVETIFSIEDQGIKRFIFEHLLTLYLNDNARARVLCPDGSYERLHPPVDAPVIDSHEVLMSRAREYLRRHPNAAEGSWRGRR